MPQPVATSATLQCSFGVAPSTLMVLPANRVMMEGKPAANIMDCAPFVNIMPFGVCSSIANPITAAQTAAALGVLTPGMCTPVTTPWSPGATKTMVANMPALTNSSTCMCAYGGQIQVVVAGTTKEQVN